MRYQNASDEPLEAIKTNTCDAGGSSLATKRFQALWNEIERLREINLKLRQDAAKRAEQDREDYLDGKFED